MAEGIASLKLYTGETVVVETICEGHSASSELSLTMVQQRLFGNLEFAIFDEERGEDLDLFSENYLLDELRTNTDFVKQIFPTERSIVLMSLRNTDKDYHDPITSYVLNEKIVRYFY